MTELQRDKTFVQMTESFWTFLPLERPTAVIMKR